MKEGREGRKEEGRDRKKEGAVSTAAENCRDVRG
jgi:hypothetical protein